MADKTISALTGASTPVAGTVVLPIVQGGATVKVSVANLTAGRDVSTASLTTTEGEIVANRYATASSLADVGDNSIGRFNNNVNSGIQVLVGITTSGYNGYIQAYNSNNSSARDLNLQPFNGNVLIGKGNLSITTTGQGVTTGSAIPLGFGVNGDTAGMTLSTSNIVTMSAYGAGAATFSAAGVISSVSDENWKRKDGVPTNPTEMLGKLQPGYWYYNDKYKDTFGVDRQLGFYAQNVNAAIGPEAAPEPEFFKVKDEEGVETLQQKPWGYYDRSVLAVVVMALQEALATVKTLEVRIQALEGKI